MDKDAIHLSYGSVPRTVVMSTSMLRKHAAAAETELREVAYSDDRRKRDVTRHTIQQPPSSLEFSRAQSPAASATLDPYHVSPQSFRKPLEGFGSTLELGPNES